MATRKRTTRAKSARKSTARKSTATKAPKKGAASTGATRKSTRKSTSAAKPPARQAAARKSPSKRSKPPKLVAYRRKRDFQRTAEPSGDAPVKRGSTLRFVVQKHAASHLHFDWRLELDGVMKSWAVPKGPSLVPGVRRLAMEVEDHPIAYNTFEGTIPEGEYGGGTVMLWDRGTYEAAEGGVESLREGYEKGKLDIVMHGERVRGAFTMVRTTGEGERAQWLLIKRTDDESDRDRDIVAEETTSVTTGRTMEEIASGKRGRKVWHSDRV